MQVSFACGMYPAYQATIRPLCASRGAEKERDFAVERLKDMTPRPKVNLGPICGLLDQQQIDFLEGVVAVH